MKVQWESRPPVCWPILREVRSPRPRDASALAAMIHEIYHVHFAHDRATWDLAAEASAATLDWWRHNNIPDADWATHQLREGIRSYLACAVPRPTPAEVLSGIIPDELIPDRWLWLQRIRGVTS